MCVDSQKLCVLASLVHLYCRLPPHHAEYASSKERAMEHTVNRRIPSKGFPHLKTPLLLGSLASQSLESVELLKTEG